MGTLCLYELEQELYVFNLTVWSKEWSLVSMIPPRERKVTR
jgi:hypothetical protein